MANEREHDLMLEWFLVELGLNDREHYRELRALAWDLVVAAKERSPSTDKRKFTS